MEVAGATSVPSWPSKQTESVANDDECTDEFPTSVPQIAQKTFDIFVDAPAPAPTTTKVPSTSNKLSEKSTTTNENNEEIDQENKPPPGIQNVKPSRKSLKKSVSDIALSTSTEFPVDPSNDPLLQEKPTNFFIQSAANPNNNNNNNDEFVVYEEPSQSSSNPSFSSTTSFQPSLLSDIPFANDDTSFLEESTQTFLGNTADAVSFLQMLNQSAFEPSPTKNENNNNNNAPTTTNQIIPIVNSQNNSLKIHQDKNPSQQPQKIEEEEEPTSGVEGILFSGDTVEDLVDYLLTSDPSVIDYRDEPCDYGTLNAGKSVVLGMFLTQ